MAAALSFRPTLEVARSERLFRDGSLAGGVWRYDVGADGRFAMVETVLPEGETARKRAIHITENWYEEFRDRE